jgi:hypothetical protein
MELLCIYNFLLSNAMWLVVTQDYGWEKALVHLIQDIPDLNLSPKTGYSDLGFYGFPHSIQKKFWIMSLKLDQSFFYIP